jgi:hypothetical protein
VFRPALALESDNGAGGSGVVPPPAPAPAPQPAGESAPGGNSWTAWAQSQLGNFFGSQPSAPAPTAPAPSPVAPTTPAPAPAAPTSTAPAVDANGFPTDESYLRDQGLSLVDLNRELVTAQETQQQLLQVLSDPTQRAAFFAEFDRNANGNGATAPTAPTAPARPSFPGGAPGQSQQLTQQDLQGWYGQMQQAAATGFPIDNLSAAYSQWDAIPNSAWQALAGTLIQGDY